MRSLKLGANWETGKQGLSYLFRSTSTTPDAYERVHDIALRVDRMKLSGVLIYFPGPNAVFTGNRSRKPEAHYKKQDNNLAVNNCCDLIEAIEELPTVEFCVLFARSL